MTQVAADCGEQRIYTQRRGQISNKQQAEASRGHSWDAWQEREGCWPPVAKGQARPRLDELSSMPAGHVTKKVVSPKPN